MTLQFVFDNVFPIGIAIFSGVMLLWSIFGNRIRGIKAVDTTAALQLINHQNAFVLDVREPAEFDAGHLLNAKLIPLGKLNARISELDKYRDKPMVVVCRSGNRSGTATALLTKAGFTQVYNMAGGVMAWQSSKLPLSK
ncbi:MAG: rhodanese-like domain-containing protein [Gallionella sp.]